MRAGRRVRTTRWRPATAFALDFRERRGDAYMLYDQEQTRRVTERPEPGACLHCHASVIPTYRRLGGGDVHAGFVALGKLSYADAHAELVKTGSANPVPHGDTRQRSMLARCGTAASLAASAAMPAMKPGRVTRNASVPGSWQSTQLTACAPSWCSSLCAELEARVAVIQDRTHALMQRAATAVVDMPQESARLAEAIDYARQAQIAARRVMR